MNKISSVRYVLISAVGLLLVDPFPIVTEDFIDTLKA